MNRFWKNGLMSFLMVLLVFQATPVGAEEPIQEARDIINNYYYEDVPTWVMQKQTIKEMVRYLDKYSVYMSHEEYENFMQSIDQQLVGIGVTLEEHANGVKILAVAPTSTGEAAGLMPGDVITQIDGESLVNKSSQHAETLLAGEEGTTVQLTVMSSGASEAKNVTVKRAVIQLPSVEYKMLGGDIGYISLYSFSENAAKEVGQAIASLKGAKGWILDLRDNGGGYVSAAQELTGMFPAVKKAYQVRYKGNEIENYNPILQKNKFIGKTHLLINNYSASASEIVAASVKEQNAATLYGQKTYGKGTMQAMFALSDDSVLKLTVARTFSPKGTAINEVGVSPNVRTSIGNELIVSHKDQLQSQYRLYKKLPMIKDAPINKTFTVKMSTAMEWSSLTSKDVQLIQLGGEEVPVTVTQVNDQSIQIKPVKALESWETYILLIHPKWTAKNARSMKIGTWVEVKVK